MPNPLLTVVCFLSCLLYTSEHILNDTTLAMFVEFAKNVWGLSGEDEYALAHAGIDALKTCLLYTSDYYCSNYQCKQKKQKVPHALPLK